MNGLPKGRTSANLAFDSACAARKSLFMRFQSSCLILAVVAGSVLAGCNGRMMLHGMHGARHAFPSASAGIMPPVAPDPRFQVSVWFVKNKLEKLAVVPVTRRVLSGDRLQQAVADLLDGPNQAEEKAGLGSEIPRGTILLGVSRTGNKVDLNLSRRFAMSGGTTSFETRLEQLKRTVVQSCGQADVYLSVEGKRLNVEEGEGIEIHQPINR